MRTEQKISDQAASQWFMNQPENFRLKLNARVQAEHERTQRPRFEIQLRLIKDEMTTLERGCGVSGATERK